MPNKRKNISVLSIKPDFIVSSLKVPRNQLWGQKIMAWKG
jgi:hypothetical protein